MPKQKMTKVQQQDFNDAIEASKCQAYVIMEHGAFLTIIETAIEEARLHPHVPAIVAAHYSFEEAEESKLVSHMVGVITVQQAPAIPIPTTVPASLGESDITVQ